MRESSRRRWPTAVSAVAAGTALSLAAVPPAMAADTVAPVLGTAAFAAAPNGNSNWRITAPQTLNLSATDDVAVSKLQYSLDGGATYIDVPVTSGPSVTAAVADSLQGNTTVRYRAVDSSGNLSRGTANEHDAEPGVGGRRDRGPAHEHDQPQRRRDDLDRHGRRCRSTADDRDDSVARRPPRPPRT